MAPRSPLPLALVPPGLFDDDVAGSAAVDATASAPVQAARPNLAPARRLLVCALPDAITRQAIEHHGDAWSGLPRGRRTRPSRLHMTLLPTRWMLPAQADALLRELATVRFAPFTLDLFPARWRDLPVLHAPSRADAGAAVSESTREARRAIEALHLQLRIAMHRAGLGWTPASLVPHVTLARGASRARPPLDAPPLRWTIDQFWAVESTPYAFEYHRLRDFPAAPACSEARAPRVRAGATLAAPQHEPHDCDELFMGRKVGKFGLS